MLVPLAYAIVLAPWDIDDLSPGYRLVSGRQTHPRTPGAACGDRRRILIRCGGP